MTFDAILAQAMKLPPRDRDRLALRLHMAEPEASDDVTCVSPAHAAFLQRRIAEYESSPGDVMSVDESLQMARRHLEEHRERHSRDSKSA